jgi:hypothetical protein
MTAAPYWSNSTIKLFGQIAVGFRVVGGSFTGTGTVIATGDIC